MKLDIPYYIRQVLREQRKVYVPGIGTLRIDQTSAQFNDDKTVIAPPSLNVTFDETEAEDDSLLRYILDAGLLTEAKARKKIEQYTQSAFNKLLNVDSFLIDGIGKLVKHADQDKVGFEPKVSDLTREFNDLTPLSLIPIARIQDQIPESGFAEGVSSSEESDSLLPRILLILLLTLLFVGLFFVGKYLINSFANQPEEEKTEISAVDEGENLDVDAATLSDSSEKELELRYEEVDELIDPGKGEKEGKNEVGTKEEEVDVPEPVVEEPKDQPETRAVPPVEASSTKPVNKHADIIPETGECIIVVGSFIKSLNAIKMVSLLERKGYNVFRSEYKGFTRIGLKYDCEDEDLEAYLHNIRKKISKKAWYLDPDLDVPYVM